MENNVPTFDFDEDTLKSDDIALRKKNANILCFISLGCMFGVPIILGLFQQLVMHLLGNNVAEEIMSALVTAISSIESLSFIAAWVLMIVARVKYKESTFAKVLMWVYIVELIIMIICVILLIIACVSIIEACKGSC